MLPYLCSGLLDPEDGAIMPLRNISNYMPVTWDNFPYESSLTAVRTLNLPFLQLLKRDFISFFCKFCERRGPPFQLTQLWHTGLTTWRFSSLVEFMNLYGPIFIAVWGPKEVFISSRYPL